MKNFCLIFAATLTLTLQAKATKIQCIGFFPESKSISMQLEISNQSSALVTVNGKRGPIQHLAFSKTAWYDGKYELVPADQDLTAFNFSFDKYSQEICESNLPSCPEVSRRLVTSLTVKNVSTGINLSGLKMLCDHAGFLLSLIDQ